MKRMVAVLAALTGGLAAGSALAEVKAVTPAGFQVEQHLTIQAPPARSYAALIDVGRWWSSEHTYSGESGNLSIDPRPGGCFCERLANGGGVQHMVVAWAQPDAVLRLLGGLGPLQGEGVSGALTFTIEPAEAHSRLRLEYVVGGYSPKGLERYAPMVDQVLAEQMARLKLYIEGPKAP